MGEKEMEDPDWDFVAERKTRPLTSDCETLTHMLKAAIGTGLFGMPLAFKNCGILLGVLFTIIVGVICTHCAYILVQCAHILYRRRKISELTFAEIGEIAFKNGPQWGRKYSKAARITILVASFASYFGTISLYTIIIANNVQQVLEIYTGYSLSIRVYISAFLLPLILLTWIPDLKSLAPVSLTANVLMLMSVGFCFYYLFDGPKSPLDMPQVAPPMDWPIFFSITIFAFETIGMIMPLENNMKDPLHFVGINGILNISMIIVISTFIFFGCIGYLKYGDAVQGTITLNFPTEDYLAQFVKVLVALVIFCTFGLQYYVCLEIVWNGTKHLFQTNVRLYEYFIRTVLTTSAVLLAIALPKIGPFMSLIGALFFSFLGLIVPVIIETIVYWDSGFGPFNWLILKNIAIFIFGIMAIILGSYTSIVHILEEYNISNKI